MKAPAASAEAPVRALLIGVDRYTGCRSLAGCVADVLEVETFLGKRPGGGRLSVRKLLAPREPRPGADGFPDLETVLRAFEEVIQETGPDEVVYVHYSGHGTRLPTEWPAMKGPRALDEALVLPQADGTGVGYLRDLVMANLLERLVSRAGAVTLVLDCCHSGGATRGRDGAGGAVVRYVEPPVAVPRRGSAGSASAGSGIEDPGPSLAELTATWRRRQEGRRWRDIHPGGLWAGRDHVFLAACRSTERALELPLDGDRPRGVLTYFLLRSLRAAGTELSYRHLYDRLVPLVQGRSPGQTPLLDGAAGLRVLGLSEAQSEPATPASEELPRLGLSTGAEPAVRYRALLDLRNPDPASPLRDALHLRLGRLPPGTSPSDPLFALPLCEIGGIDELSCGEWAVLGLANRSAYDLCLALFDLRPDGTVARILPDEDSGPFLHLEAGAEERIALRASLPEGLSRGLDTLKALATLEPVDFDALEIEAGGSDGAGPARSAPGPLEPTAWPDWTSASIEVRVRSS